MTYDELSTVLQVIGGVVLTLSFVVGAAIIWAGIKANKEKDEKTRLQEIRIAELNTETASLKVEAEHAKTERADADKEIALAKAEAAKANEETARLNTEAENAKKQIAIALVDAAEAHKKTTELEQTNLNLRASVATLETEASKAKLAYLELSERVRPRHLSPEQIREFSQALESRRKGTVALIVLGDQEAQAYATEIAQVIKSVGWQIEISIIGIQTPKYGIAIYSPNINSTETKALVSAFQRANIGVDIFEDKQVTKETIGIWLKPVIR